MSLFVFGSLAAMVTAVAWALYGDQIAAAFAGSGKRRKPSAADLAKTVADLRQQLAEAKQPSTCINCGHLTGWPTGAELADSDRSDPAPHIHAPAPVDNGSRDIPLTAAATVRDASLADMALPGEEEMAAFLEAERAKNAETVTLPAVPDRSPTPDPVTTEVEARLNIPAPSPLASATSVPVTSALKAVSKVHATVTTD